jgi:bifunctional NMN adenylyltransferase/nudix hydrolase
MEKKYDVVVYRGRFQGFHNAHLQTILMGLQVAKKVIVVVGSANEPRTFYRNPFFENERIEMIRGALEDHFRHEDVHFTTVEDNPNDYVWAENVEEQVHTLISAIDHDEPIEGAQSGIKIAQIGFKKDANCVRDVELFPDWEYVETPHFEPLDATQVRDIFFSKRPLGFLRGVCPESVIQYLKGFRTTEDFAELMAEKKFCEDYQKQFDGLEYAPTFVTGDNVAFQDDTVLLVKRKNYPGKGLWGFPAGFFNAADRVTKRGEVVKADKSVWACAIRELFEEANADVAEEELRLAMIGREIFDAEGRDPRGRFVTHAYAYNFDGQPVFNVEAADDAEEVRRFHVNDINRRMMYADHYSILIWAYGQYMASKAVNRF